MIAQEFWLRRYGWHVNVLYAVTRLDAGLVVRMLRRMGCGGSDLRRALRNLTSGNTDTGLTYSDEGMREMLVVISDTSSPAQFLNSWTHEMSHLCRHVSRACGIDPWGEEYAYLAGDAAQSMFPVARMLLCGHCRDKLAREMHSHA